MIKNDGNGLSILLLTEPSIHNEWLSFVTWYTICQFLPQVNFCLAYRRNDSPIIAHWTYKFATKRFFYSDATNNKILVAHHALKHNLVSQPLLVLTDHAMIVRDFSEKAIQVMESSQCMNFEDHVLFFNHQELETFEAAINTKVFNFDADANLVTKSESNNETLSPVVYFDNTIAKFDLREWQKYDVAPFGYVNKFRSLHMSVNENQILDLWKQIFSLYEIVR